MLNGWDVAEGVVLCGSSEAWMGCGREESELSSVVGSREGLNVTTMQCGQRGGGGMVQSWAAEWKSPFVSVFLLCQY